MKLRIAGKLGRNNEAAIPRAKSYHGIQPHNEFFADCVIQYKNDVATIVPLPVSQYVPMVLPNPIPYRGVSIGVVDKGDGFGTATYIVASNGEVLAREAQIVTIVRDPSTSILISYTTDSIPVTAYGDNYWGGSNYLWMMKQVLGTNMGSGPAVLTFHKLNFSAPEDCVYPAASTTGTPPSYPDNNDPSNPPSQAVIDQWNADWLAAQTALKLRRKLWFKKNSDTVLGQLEAGAYALPATWENSLKASARFSIHTYRTPHLTESVATELLIDDEEGGIRIYKRTATLSYEVIIDGEAQTHVYEVIGTFSRDTNNSLTTDSYDNWYEPYLGLSPGVPQGLGDLNRISTQLYKLKFSEAWSGTAITEGDFYYPDSTWALPGNPLIHQTPYSNTIVGTASQFILDYRVAVPLKYDKTGVLASTFWNDSALADGQLVSIILYGPVKDGEDLGLFGEPGGDGEGEIAAQATMVYGKATYSYSEGMFTFVKWAYPTPANEGDEPGPVSIPLRPDSNNTIVQYIGLQWPDVIAAARTANKALQPPVPPAEDTRTDAQKLQYEITHAFS